MALPLTDADEELVSDCVVLALLVALGVTDPVADEDPVCDAVVEAVALSDSEVLTVSLVVAEPEPD